MAEGFTNFIISVYYLSEVIKDYFEDGTRMGINITYIKEDNPLGTAGALSIINPKPLLPFVVTNGEVMTDIRYGYNIDSIRDVLMPLGYRMIRKLGRGEKNAVLGFRPGMSPDV